MKTLYKIGATATNGRNGKVTSENGVLALDVRHPKALGGANDDYPNPEMLFAMGYAACFDSALNLVIKQAGATTGTTSVTANVGIGQIENGGFGLEVNLNVNVPEVSQKEAQALVEKAHEVCPYSNAVRGNVEVTLNVTNQ